MLPYPFSVAQPTTMASRATIVKPATTARTIARDPTNTVSGIATRPPLVTKPPLPASMLPYPFPVAQSNTMASRATIAKPATAARHVTIDPTDTVAGIATKPQQVTKELQTKRKKSWLRQYKIPKLAETDILILSPDPQDYEYIFGQ